MPCDITELSNAATCFQCLPPQTLDAVKTQLLCDWSSGPVVEELRITEDSETRLIENGEERIIE